MGARVAAASGGLDDEGVVVKLEEKGAAIGMKKPVRIDSDSAGVHVMAVRNHCTRSHHGDSDEIENAAASVVGLASVGLV